MVFSSIVDVDLKKILRDLGNDTAGRKDKTAEGVIPALINPLSSDSWHILPARLNALLT
jgi:hypothetical protein